jgi:hypothetical protein
MANMREKSGNYTSPVKFKDFPPTLRNCGEDPSTCIHMTGTDLYGDGSVLMATICMRPFTVETVEVEVGEQKELVTFYRIDIEKVYCGFDDPFNGIKRKPKS